MKNISLVAIIISLSQKAFAAAGVVDVADDDPNLFLLMMVILVVFIVTAVLGTILAVIAAAIVALLAGLSILSYSVVKGWQDRSLSSGIETFFRLYMVAGGVCTGGFILLILAALNVPFIHFYSFIAAILIVSGIAGWVCYRLVMRVFWYVAGR